jgi:hypothetical protein
MTLKGKRVRLITSLFKVGFYNYFTEMIYILRRLVAQHLGRYLEGQGHNMTLNQNRVQPLLGYLKSDFISFSQK